MSFSMTTVVIVAELSPLPGSYVAELTVAVSIMALHNPAVTFTTNVSVIVLPEASVGTPCPFHPSVGSVHDPRMMERY